MGDDEEDKENIKITMTNANETDSEPSNKSTKTSLFWFLTTVIQLGGKLLIRIVALEKHT